LLEHLQDPLGAVQLMVRAARPGGRIVLADDDHDVMRLWPDPPGFRILWEEYIRTYSRYGMDPYVGRHLVSLLYQAGAIPKRNTWIWFGACAGNPAFELLSQNLILVLTGARNSVLEDSKMSPDSFDESINALAKWSKNPEAALWYSICWAEAARPK
jgi:hypothetical protein